MEVYNEILGVKLKIPDEPKKIVSLAPNITETLFLLGLKEEIVGVSYYCNKPEEIKNKPRVGSYINVDLDKLKELEPDLVFTTTGAQRETNKLLVNEGLPVFPIPLPTSVHGIIENIWVIGNLVNRLDEARKLVEDLTMKLSKVMVNRSDYKPRVYWEVSLGGPITAGAPSHVDMGISIAGGVNIFNDVRVNYFKPDWDEVKRRNPEIFIYEPQAGKEIDMDSLMKLITNRDLSDIDAVLNGNVFLVECDFFAHYGPSFISAIEWLNNKIREIF